jgi:ribosome-associated translation inhibitor RaiA
MPRQTQTLPPSIPHAAKRSAGRTSAAGTPLHIRGHHVEIDPSVERYVRERTSRKLAKFAHEEQRITVRFEDLNGPKGGIAVACRIKIVIPAAPSIVVEDRAAGLRDAFDLAIDNAERALRHSLDKHGRSEGKPARGKRHVAELDAQERAEALDAVATDETPVAKPRHQQARAPRATASLEASATGRPSRKSTRKSANRVKQGTELQHRQLQTMYSPEERAARGRGRGGAD